MKLVKKENYVSDPTGVRSGNPPEKKLADTLLQVSSELEDYIDKVIAQRQIPEECVSKP